MENICCFLALYMFLTDIGLFWGTLRHVRAMVFNMSSIFFPSFCFLSFTMCFCTFRRTGRPGGQAVRAVRAVRAGGVYLILYFIQYMCSYILDI